MRSLAVPAFLALALILSSGRARLPAPAGTISSGIRPAWAHSSMVAPASEQCSGGYRCRWVTVQACFQQANGKPTLGHSPHRGCAAYRIVIHFWMKYNGAAVAVDPISVECDVPEKHVAVHVGCQAVNAGERIFHHAGVIAAYAGPGYDSQIHVIVNTRGRVAVTASHGVAQLPGRTAANNPQVFKDLENIVLADMRPPPPASPDHSGDWTAA